VNRLRRVAAEAVGTALLLAAVVGSGIMGERLAGGHFNPAVTLADASQGGLPWREVPWREVPGYVAAQMFGALAGVAAAHVMFEEPLFSASRHVRAGGAQIFSEFIATFGLLAVIWGCARLRSAAVTLARSASDTFAGIRLVDVPGFVLAQLAGAAAATLLFRWLVPSLPKDATAVVARG
jgi:glycerol uptake facilitator-like aquaporin